MIVDGQQIGVLNLRSESGCIRLRHARRGRRIEGFDDAVLGEARIRVGQDETGRIGCGGGPACFLCPAPPHIHLIPEGGSHMTPAFALPPGTQSRVGESTVPGPCLSLLCLGQGEGSGGDRLGLESSRLPSGRHLGNAGHVVVDLGGQAHVETSVVWTHLESAVHHRAVRPVGKLNSRSGPQCDARRATAGSSLGSSVAQEPTTIRGHLERPQLSVPGSEGFRAIFCGPDMAEA